MFTPKKLEDLIKDKIPLGMPSNTGFYQLKCPICNDYKIRAGFKFENGEIGYNCFNCGYGARYEEMGGDISRKMRRVLTSCGVDDSEISNVVNSSFFGERKKEEKITLEALKKVNTTTPTIKLPPNSYPLGETEEFPVYQIKLIEYLDSRKIDLAKYKFFFSLEKRFIDRVIIPFYRHGELIFWQARAIDPNEKTRYDSPFNSKEAVLFNFDELYSYSNLPLFVTEGAFDAMMFDGIAILGSKLNDAKIELLRKSKRRLIFVIDKDKTGGNLAKQAIDNGWEITFTPDGTKDINQSVVRFGKTWTALQLMKNVPKNNTEAKLLCSLRCA